MTAPLNLDALEAAARAAGGGTWTSSDADGYVFGDDGDGICLCYPNIGHHPEPVFPDQLADYIAAANPATVLALIAMLRDRHQDVVRTNELLNAQHRSTAAATLHAAQGWQRYEEANRDRNAVREERVQLVQRIAELEQLLAAHEGADADESMRQTERAQ